jgi:hypothetical protein
MIQEVYPHVFYFNFRTQLISQYFGSLAHYKVLYGRKVQ